jgi:hypothetical protein
MDDLISRRAAIDVLSVGKEILSRVLDDMDVVGTDREKYSWGLGLIEEYINDIEELPSTQPEVIWCKDCKYHSHDAGYGHDWCNRTSGVFRVKPDDFCSFAVRKDTE